MTIWSRWFHFAIPSVARGVTDVIVGSGALALFFISTRRIRPAHQRNRSSHDVERTEDELVVLRDPQRQIDVEVFSPIIGVPGCYRRQWAAAAIERKHDNFYRNDSGKPASGTVVSVPRRNWNRQNAAGKQCPNDGVHNLDHSQSGGCTSISLWIMHEEMPGFAQHRSSAPRGRAHKPILGMTRPERAEARRPESQARPRVGSLLRRACGGQGGDWFGLGRLRFMLCLQFLAVVMNGLGLKIFLPTSFPTSPPEFLGRNISG